MKQQGILTVISGFSGAGKGTLVKRLLEQHQYGLSISATTRKPRDGEADGREYFFLTKEEFEKKIEEQAFIEWAQYVGNYYGTPRAYVESQLQQGQDVILEIEVEGAFNVRKLFPDALLLFVTPPTALDLEKRLQDRGTEDEDTITKRLERAGEESVFMKQYDFVVVNDDLEQCMEEIHQMIQNRKNEIRQAENMVQKMQTELKELIEKRRK